MPAPVRVLLVEADERAAAGLASLIASLPDAPEVERAAGFAEALSRMASPRFDAHIVAARLGGKSGIDLLRIHRASGGETPVILIAGEAEGGDDRAAMEAGAAFTLERDRLDAALLGRTIRYAVETARRAGALRRARDELEARVAERTDALQTMNAALLAEVADRRAAERALREADRRKDEFLATLAHELRNPLAPLASAVEILSHTAEAARRENALRVVERQVAHMVRLIGDLIDVSRITHGKLELRRDRVPLSSVVESALETARPLLDARRHALELRLPAKEVPLHVDPMRLAQALANLLANAAKYTEPGGRVRLQAERDGADVVLTVADSGIGIPPDHLAHVFTMFGQGPRARAAVSGGLGIGLALAKDIVERHGGRVTASSEGEGKGSVFSIRIPLAPDDAVPTREPTEEKDVAVAPRRILVVDDNVEAALTLAELLALRGHETHVAHDGPSGVEAARHLKPDVAILDLGLPGFDGHEAARRLRADPELAGLLLVALSGWVQPEDQERSRAAGFRHHLAKPVALRTLERVLRQASRDPVRTP